MRGGSRRPILLDRAIDELLRLGGPVQLDARRLTRRAVLAGTELAEGDDVCVLTGAANRDPEVFDRPAELVVTRDPNPHLGFGHGMHLCLGAPTARMLTTAVLAEVLRILPDYEVTAVEHGRGLFVRGPVSVVVRA